MADPAPRAHAAAAPLPAKLVRRRLDGMVDRPRLFACLDAAAARPLVWVQGPAGSGKTTLVASYADRLGAPTLWYRADEGDADPASCFANLALAAAACPGARAVALPVLAPEGMPDLAAFARRFLRLLFAALPANCLLVFDEVDAAPGDVLALLLQTACSELRPVQRALATSRHAPPVMLAHLSTKGAMAALGWPELRLTPTEARAIAELRLAAAPAQTEELLAASDGWIAGYVVLLDAAHHAGGGTATRHAIDEQVFPYFVNEILARTGGPARALLMRTAVLAEFTAAQANALCPQSDAGAALDALCREIGFIERSDAEPPRYRCHPLFRDFLRHRLEQELPAAERRQLERQAAQLLRSQGQGEEALALYAEAGAWSEAIDTLAELAPGWLAQGRNVTLERALARLPEQAAQDWPWLHFWRGMARMASAPTQARAEFEAAFAAFERAGDVTACVTACSAILETTLHQWGDLHHLDHWGDVLRELLARAGPTLPAEVGARALASASVLMMRGYRHKDLVDSALSRTLAMLPLIGPRRERFGAAALANLLLCFKCDWAAGARLAREVEAWLEPGDAPPLQRVLWHAAAGANQLWNGDFADAQRNYERARAIAAANDLRAGVIVNEGLAATLALHLRDPAQARACIDAAWSLLMPGRLLDASNIDRLESMLALAEGRSRTALVHARRALAVQQECGSLAFEMDCSLCLAMALTLDGDLEAAAATAGKVQAYAEAAALGALRHSALLIRAWAELRAGRAQSASALLREGLALGRAQDLRVVFPWAPMTMLQELGVLALRHRIEPDLVCEMLRLGKVAPPADAPPEWPWRLRTWCLGRFEVRVDNSALPQGSKAPKKPLELLKALLAHEAPTPVANLLEHLWPDLDGDAAQNAFNVALLRLRRLLGDDRAVTLRDGHAAIDLERLWSDVRALHRLTDETDTDCAAETAARLLALYRGPLFADHDVPWAEPYRQRLRSRFLRRCGQLAARLEQDRDWDAAIDLHRGVVERDPVAETFHRGLMRCLLAQGREAEACDAYRCCAQALQAATGAQPGPETRALLARAAGPRGAADASPHR